MRIHILAAYIVIWAPAVSARAHEYTILRLEGDKLIGLPEGYSPAQFDWNQKRLRVGRFAVDLDAFENIIPLTQKYKVAISSSWYHKGSALPPYIGVNLISEERGLKYTILFCLDNLEVIYVALEYRIKDSESIRIVHHKLLLPDSDSEQIKRRTITIE